MPNLLRRFRCRDRVGSVRRTLLPAWPAPSRLPAPAPTAGKW